MGGVVSGLVIVLASGVVFVRWRSRRSVPISELDEDHETSESAPIIIKSRHRSTASELLDKDRRMSCMCFLLSPFSAVKITFFKIQCLLTFNLESSPSPIPFATANPRTPNRRRGYWGSHTSGLQVKPGAQISTYLCCTPYSYFSFGDIRFVLRCGVD
jgi:hypothetical protein